MTDAPERIWVERMATEKKLYVATSSEEVRDLFTEEGRALVEYILRDACAKYVEVKPLVWDIDGRQLCLDDTVVMSKGYDWDGYELCRSEAYGLCASYIIWPDSLTGRIFNLYCTTDGLLITDIKGEEAAKSAAQADYERRIRAALA